MPSQKALLPPTANTTFGRNTKVAPKNRRLLIFRPTFAFLQKVVFAAGAMGLIKSDRRLTGCALLALFLVWKSLRACLSRLSLGVALSAGGLVRAAATIEELKGVGLLQAVCYERLEIIVQVLLAERHIPLQPCREGFPPNG